MSGETSQPNLNSVVAALATTPRDSGARPGRAQPVRRLLGSGARILRAVRHRPEVRHGRGVSARDARRPIHQPQGAGRSPWGLGARWHEIARTYAEVNMAFGDIVKVTPSSKVVGDMAIFLVNHNMTMEQFERLGPDHNLTLPALGDRDVHGRAGRARRRLAEAAAESIILRGAKPQRGRPGAHLPPVNLEETAATMEKKIGHDPARDEVLSYLMYPEVFLKFAQGAPELRRTWRCCPRRSSIYGMKRGEEIAVELEPGKALVIKFLTVGEPHPDGTRTVFFELNGQPREVTVRDRSLEVKEPPRPRPTPRGPARSARPFPGWFRPWRWS